MTVLSHGTIVFTNLLCVGNQTYTATPTNTDVRSCLQEMIIKL